MSQLVPFFNFGLDDSYETDPMMYTDDFVIKPSMGKMVSEERDAREIFLAVSKRSPARAYAIRLRLRLTESSTKKLMIGLDRSRSDVTPHHDNTKYADKL